MVSNSPLSSQPDSDLGVVIPIKTFGQAKVRLAAALTGPERIEFAQRSADRVVQAAAPADTFVVCDDDEVATWAHDRGCRILTPPEPGLNRAVHFGVAELRRRGYPRVIIAHGDLPLAQQLGWVADFFGVSIVTDHHGDGTNVLSIPTNVRFGFAYGPGSARRHHREALNQGLSVRWIRHRQLSHDVDTPEDLARLDAEIRRRLAMDRAPTNENADRAATDQAGTVHVGTVQKGCTR